MILLCTFSFTKIGEYCRNRRKEMFLQTVLKKVKVAEIEREERECPICLLEYEEGEEVVMGNCEHKYHEECLMGWLEGQNNCPLCREVFY